MDVFNEIKTCFTIARFSDFYKLEASKSLILFEDLVLVILFIFCWRFLPSIRYSLQDYENSIWVLILEHKSPN